jgi:hypothetical protein
MPESQCFNDYHVDPEKASADPTGRYSLNFVPYPGFLAPLRWGDGLSRAFRGRSAYQIGDSLLQAFDRVGPLHRRWGTPLELEALRRNIALFSRNIDQGPFLSPIGRFLLRRFMKAHLHNRARTIAFYEGNRAFIESNGRYDAPLLVTGSFRSGTTLLQRLLTEDPNTRSPLTFELERTTPPRQAGQDPALDPRVKKSAATMALLTRLAPGFVEKIAESHLWSPLEREESLPYCQIHNGLSIMNAPGAGRDFLRSMCQPDVADALLKYERNFFKMLDAYLPARSHWTNKSPAYALYFGKIFQHYPNARVVVTHRHPGKTMASACRLFESWLVPFDLSGSLDKVRLADIITDVFRSLYLTPLTYRQGNPDREGQIIDCRYLDLVSDPIGTVKSIYERFALEYSPAFEKRMTSYLKANWQGKHGRHKYSNEEYGIDLQRLYDQNREYFEYYRYRIQPNGDD